MRGHNVESGEIPEFVENTEKVCAIWQERCLLSTCGGCRSCHTLVSWGPLDEKWRMWGMGSQAIGSSVSSGSMSPYAHRGERRRRLDRGGRPSVQPGVRAGLPSGWGRLVFLTS